MTPAETRALVERCRTAMRDYGPIAIAYLDAEALIDIAEASLPTLTAERDALRAEVERLRSAIGLLPMSRGELAAENDRLRAALRAAQEALERIDRMATIPAAEYVPALPDIWCVAERAIKAIQGALK